MNIRWVLAGVAVLAFAVGGYFADLFKGWGPGPGFSGSGTGDGAAEHDSARSPASTEPEADLVGIVGDANRMLLVLVDGRSYSIGEMRDEKTVMRSSSLEEIATLAKDRPGSEDGVRVRITRTKTSKATTEIALRDELLKAGLKAEEIEWENGPLP